MKNYELVYTANPEISQDGLEELSQKIGGIVKISKASKPERRRLGYEINGKKEAFLVSIDFSSEAGKIAELKKMLDAEKSILRKIIIIKPKERPEEEERIPQKESKSQKVELEKIDEKIDEILK